MEHFAQIPRDALTKPVPFKVAIPDEQLEEFNTLLRLAKVSPETYENTQNDGRYGITRDWLLNAKSEGEKWDWRAHEEQINSIPNFKIAIKDQAGDFDVHFVGLFSQKADPIPILLLHGWPGSFMEFYSIIKLLSERYTPETLPYHIIAPSLPGYAFSSPPPTMQDFQLQDVARIMNTLMIELGFESGFVVQGGDIGSKVSRVMAATYDTVKAIHINFCIMPRPDGIDESQISESENRGVERLDDFKRLGSAYALLHATRPATIGHVLSSNPLALLAWIGEKFLAWTDEDPSLDEILASVSLYWFTDTFSSSIYPYRQLFTPGVIGARENPDWYIRKPMGFSWFPKELAPTPRAWVATTGDLVFYRQHERGGHFAAMEEPEAFLRDVEDFVEQVWVW